MNKVDQVAQAIADYWLSDGFDPSEPSEGAARAAIAAMRVPTEAMVAVARRSAPYDRDVTETWPLMIDEALK